MFKLFQNTLIVLTIGVLLSSCSKEEFLNKKPKKSLVVPNTIEHLQALLDMDAIMNGLDGQGITPQLGESSTDNYFLMEDEFNANLRPQFQNYYLFNRNPYEGIPVTDWEFPYRAILTTNTVVEGLSKIERTPEIAAEWDNLLAQAYFHQAHLYYQLAQVFAPAYNRMSLESKPGLPLRSTADINEIVVILSLNELYDFIIDRLKQSIPSLSLSKAYPHRGTKQSAYGLLARVYLTMGMYEDAKLYADSCLAIQDYIYDFNDVNLNATYPFYVTSGDLHPVQNEIIFSCAMLAQSSVGYPIGFSHALVDTNLYDSYDDDDLRKSVFFRPRGEGYRFVGSYLNVPNYYFSGIATDEIVLTRAECLARLGELQPALDDLNMLLVKRWKKGTYHFYRDLSREETLDLILRERRKELLFRGTRWIDIRRLSIEDNLEPNLIRVVNGQEYRAEAPIADWSYEYPPEVIIRPTR